MLIHMTNLSLQGKTFAFPHHFFHNHGKTPGRRTFAVLRGHSEKMIRTHSCKPCAFIGVLLVVFAQSESSMQDGSSDFQHHLFLL
jgi:hypothetical protein